jgi:hypothetical protein
MSIPERPFRRLGAVVQTTGVPDPIRQLATGSFSGMCRRAARPGNISPFRTDLSS